MPTSHKWAICDTIVISLLNWSTDIFNLRERTNGLMKDGIIGHLRFLVKVIALVQSKFFPTVLRSELGRATHLNGYNIFETYSDVLRFLNNVWYFYSLRVSSLLDVLISFEPPLGIKLNVDEDERFLIRYAFLEVWWKMLRWCESYSFWLWVCFTFLLSEFIFHLTILEGNAPLFSFSLSFSPFLFPLPLSLLMVGIQKFQLLTALHENYDDARCVAAKELDTVVKHFSGMLVIYDRCVIEEYHDDVVW